MMVSLVLGGLMGGMLVGAEAGKKKDKKVEPAPQGPDASVSVEGFEVNVFARPFEVEYPTAIAAGPDGTVYVSQDRNGSLGKGHPGKVRACQDTDGDGVADKFWDYIPDVLWPRGGHMVGGKFYLIHPPYLSVFEDRDGDGVAETQTKLVDGFGASQNDSRGADHTTNGVRMGIDGWLYVAVGDFGMTRSTGTDGKVVSLRGGGVARVRPDGTELEVYSFNSRNQCDMAISPYLDLFTRDNTNDGKGWNIRVHHHTNLCEHGYPRLYKNFAEEAVKPLLDLGGGSGTGALYLHEPGFPEGYGERLFTCDWTTGKVYEHGLEGFEATFQATQGEFMNLNRAIDIDVDGESTLYTADWRGATFRFVGEGNPVGLIHRVVPKGEREVEAWPDLGAMADGDLVKQVGHRSAVRRLEAQAEVLKRGLKGEFDEELKAIVEGDGELYGKVAAIFTFKQLYGAEANKALMGWAKDAEVREFALRALGDRRGETEGIPMEVWMEGLRDENPRVQLQAAVGIERSGAKGLARDLIVAAAKGYEERLELEGQDDYRFPHTAVQVLGKLGAVEACLAAVKDQRTRGIALAALKLMPEEAAVEGLAKLLEEAGSDVGLKMELMEVLARLSHREGEWDGKAWWSTRPDDRGPYFVPVEWSGSGVAVASLEKAFGKLESEGQEKMLEVFAANRLDVMKMDLGELDPVLTAMGMTVLSKGHVELLTGAALDSGRNWEQRLACFRKLLGLAPEKYSGEGMEVPLRGVMRVLAGWHEEEGLEEESERELMEFVNGPGLVSHRGELRKIAKMSGAEVSRVAWRALLSLSQSVLIKDRFREQVMKMAQSNPREVGYFRALAEMKLTGFEGPIENALDSDNRRLIDAAQAAKDAIAAAQDQAGGKRIAEMSSEEVLEEAIVDTGQVELGKEVFSRVACAACHAVSLDEVQKGPYLGSAGSKFTRDYLIESVTEPGKAVAQGFRTYLVTMKDDSVHMGFVTREEDGELDVRNIGGVVTTLKEAEIASREQQEMSMMPAGLAAGLTLGEFTALMDYLGSLKEG
ncbi:MAG: hypothetical protein AAGC74_01660 [Verrucomicrobiota bacterium]